MLATPILIASRPRAGSAAAGLDPAAAEEASDRRFGRGAEPLPQGEGRGRAATEEPSSQAAQEARRGRRRGDDRRAAAAREAEREAEEEEVEVGEAAPAVRTRRGSLKVSRRASAKGGAGRRARGPRPSA